MLHSGPAASAESGGETWTILMVVAHENFRDEEYFEPRKIFDEAGAEVVVASSALKAARGMLGGEVTPDKLVTDIEISDYDAIVFVGGSGAQEYFENETVLEIAREAGEQRKVLGAICIAPVILANAGLLEGMRATVWSSMSDRLEKKGAEYVKTDVVGTGRLVTGSGPAAAGKFAREILKVLKGGSERIMKKPAMIPAAGQAGRK